MGKVMALKWRSTENWKTISYFASPAERSEDCNVGNCESDAGFVDYSGL